MFGSKERRERKNAVEVANRIIKTDRNSLLAELDVKSRSVYTGKMLASEVHKDDRRVPLAISFDTYNQIRNIAREGSPKIMISGQELPVIEDRRACLQTVFDQAFANEDGSVAITLSFIDLERLNILLRENADLLPELIDVNLAFQQETGRKDVYFLSTAPDPIIQTSRPTRTD